MSTAHDQAEVELRDSLLDAAVMHVPLMAGVSRLSSGLCRMQVWMRFWHVLCSPAGAVDLAVAVSQTGAMR